MSKADIKSIVEQNHEKFWSEFKSYCNEHNPELIFMEINEDKSNRKGDYYSHKIKANFNPEHSPEHITVRGNSYEKHIRCQIRFYGDLELKFFENMNVAGVKENILKELEKGITDPSLQRVEWKPKAKGKETLLNSIRSSYDVGDLFNEYSQEKNNEYFEWLTNNIKIYLKEFKKYCQ